jgi:hypothetical protein
VTSPVAFTNCNAQAQKKIALCAAALVAAAIASQLAQAGGNKGGVSANSPGHTTVPTGSADPGKSANAPGDRSHDTGTPAKELAPGDANKKNKKQ